MTSYLRSLLGATKLVFQKSPKKVLPPISDTELRQTALQVYGVKYVSKENNHSFTRLALLGDSLLGYHVAHHLHEKFPYYSNGQLSACRSMLVCSYQLSSFAVEWGLDRMTNVDLKAAKTNKRILGEALEAYIGAYYLDACTLYGDNYGHTKVRELCIELVDPLLEQMMKTWKIAYLIRNILYIRLNEAVQEKKLQLRLQRIKGGTQVEISKNSKVNNDKGAKKAKAVMNQQKEKPNVKESKKSQKLTGQIVPTKKETIIIKSSGSGAKLTDSGKSTKITSNPTQEASHPSHVLGAVQLTQKGTNVIKQAKVKKNAKVQTETNEQNKVAPTKSKESTKSSKLAPTANLEKSRETDSSKRNEDSLIKPQTAKNESPKPSRVVTNKTLRPTVKITQHVLYAPPPERINPSKVKITTTKSPQGVSTGVTSKRRNPHLPNQIEHPIQSFDVPFATFATDFKELSASLPTVTAATNPNVGWKDSIAAHFTVKKPRLNIPTTLNSKLSKITPNVQSISKKLRSPNVIQASQQKKTKEVSKQLSNTKQVAKLVVGQGLVKQVFTKVSGAVIRSSENRERNLRRRQEDLSKLSIQELLRRIRKLE
ncbi:4422_t:CDS:2 [Acaulospora morrowiae]|uniref:4422_t:CDS:1 n=1 Tax=Acaulospora morrowiae TaxID=94023 RepID=A0A9N8W4P3_9GLOM|nr:4422_t:CDS:2 [Acaulospora morrowiae]